MINPWHDIDPSRITPENFIAIVEIPKGSKKKYELDKETGMIRLDRILFTATHYPMNYGFIPRTYADDRDPLDVLVLCSETLDPMVMVECYPIGVVKMIDNQEIDEKIIAIPFKDPVYNGYRDINTLPQHLLQEISHFFEVYKALEHSETSVKMIVNREKALGVIAASMKAYDVHFNIKKKKKDYSKAESPKHTSGKSSAKKKPAMEKANAGDKPIILE